MKILFITDEVGISGTTTYLNNFLSTFLRMKRENEFFCVTFRDRSTPPYAYSFPTGKNSNHTSLSIYNLNSYLSLVHRSLKLFSLFLKKKERFDLVIVDIVLPALAYKIAALFSPYLRNTCTLFFFHGSQTLQDKFETTFPQKPFFLKLRCILTLPLERYIYTDVDFLATNSKYSKEILETAVGIQRDIKVWQLGIDQEIWQFQKRTSKKIARSILGMNKNHNFILLIGRIEERKGFHTFLEYFSKKSKLFPDTSIIFCSDFYNVHRSFFKRIDQWKLSTNIFFVNNPTKKQLSLLYRAGDVTIVPSLDLETFGLVTLESLFCGTPVIAFDIGANADLIPTEFLVPTSKDQFNKLIDKTRKVLSQKRYYQLKIQKYQQRFSDHFTWKKHVQHFISDVKIKHNKKKFRFFSLSLIGMSLLAFSLSILRIHLAFSSSLFFDEGAAWYTANYTSFLNIVLGKYTHVGDLPLTYIIIKIISFFSSSEGVLRLCPFSFSFATIIVFYKICSLYYKKQFALLASLLFYLLPLHTFYGIELKSYMMAFFFQILSLYFFLCFHFSSEKVNLRKNYIFFFFSFFLALFSSFSSVFLGVFFVLYQVLLLLKRKVFSTQIKILFLIGINFLFFLIWFYYFLHSSEARISLNNYVNLHTPFSLELLSKGLHDLLFFRQEWGGIPPTGFLWDWQKEATSLFSSIFIPVSFLFSLLLVIVKILRRKDFSLSFFFSMLYAWMFFEFFLFSKMFFPVTYTRFMLLLSVPMILYITQTYYFFVLHENSLLRKIGQIFLTLIVFLIISSNCQIFNTLRYPFENIYQYFQSEVTKSKNSCNYLIVSHEIAYDLVLFYNHKHHLTSNSKTVIIPFLINYNSSTQLSEVEKNLEKVSRLSPSLLCDQLMKISYFENQNSKTEGVYAKISQIEKNYVYRTTYQLDPYFFFTIFGKR
jgi:glycosyltransferase involved in cell wall biosynthesis